MLAVFLPVRLLFYTYVSHNWLGNLGIMSIIAIAMFILVQKNKLGWFGRYFKNRIRRLVFHRIIWLPIFSSLFAIIIYGFILYEINKAEFEYEEIRNQIFASTIYFDVKANTNENTTSVNYLVYVPLDKQPLQPMTFTNLIVKNNIYPPDEVMIWYGNLDKNETQDWFDEIFNDDSNQMVEVVGSIMIYLINLEYGAWGSHFLTVIVLEETEAIILLIFYRRAYFHRVGTDWKLVYGFSSRSKMKKMGYRKSKTPTANVKKEPAMKFAYYDFRKHHPKVQSC